MNGLATSGPVRRLERVLMLLPSAGIGGAEVHSAWLAQGLAAAGVLVRLAVGPAVRDRFAGLLGPGLASALQAAPVGWDGGARLAANLARQSAAAAALLAEWRPDAVVLPLPWPTHGLGLQQALAAAAVPVLAVAHLAPHAFTAEELAAARAARLGPTRWTAVSEAVAARLAQCFGLPAGTVATVPNGVAVPPWEPARQTAARAAKRVSLGLRGQARLVVFAGRLEPNKGADLLPGIAELLPGIAELLHGRTGAVLAALGEGPLRPGLAQHPAAGGDPARAMLRLPGHAADVAEWLLAADALLLPSRLEGCPLVFLEAAAHRCPVVATGAALEALGDAASGLAAVAPEASVASLADRAEACLTEPPATAARVAAAWRHVAAHDRAAMLRRYAALLRAMPAG